MKFALLLLSASLGLAQVPTITNIAVTNVTHNSVTLRFTSSSGAAWVSCLLGTVSGTYTAQRCPNYQVGSTVASFSLGGLAPSTTYYIRPTAQPNQTNTTNICNADGCGAVEQTFTTSADPSLPVMPAVPTAYSVPNPDTSGYTIVRMVAGATSADECKAFATSGPITAGDTVQTVLNKITLGYVLEFDQGITCPIPNTGTFNSGYILPHVIAGSGYVVLRTKTVSNADFPPFGTRTSPALCAKCATFKATRQFATSGFSAGQIFQSTTGGAQHFVIQNLFLTVDQTISAPSGNCGGSNSCWGELISFGNGTGGGDPASDDNALDRVVIRGSCNSSVDTFRAIALDSYRTAIVNSWIDCIWAHTVFAQGIAADPGGTGPYTIDNNYIECVCMTLYQEADSGYLNPANDVTVTHNTLYWPLSKINAGYLARQQIEFKGGHRILIQGNLIDGCWVYQNECPAVYMAGTNNTVSGDGISDVNVNYNLIRNAATVFDCRGVPTADGGSPGPSPNISQRISLQNNWAYNLGYQFIGMGASGGGVVSSYIVQRPGCTDMTVNQNTLGFTNPQDMRSGSTLDFIPAIYEFGGGTSLAANFTHTNNILYMNVSAGSYNGGRIFADVPQINPSFPALPAITFNSSGGANAPSAILNSYSVNTTNGTVKPSVTWSGNVNICGVIGAGSNSWSGMTSAQCTTWQSGMPAGDTWAAGDTIAAREANVGFNATTGICSGCGGAGANIGTLYSTMKVVTGISVVLSGTSATFTYTAPDARACDVDTSPDSSTWTRHVDVGGSTTRTVTVTGIGATYSYRILCYFSQTAPLFSGSQVTDGVFTNGAAFSRCDLNMDGVTNVLDVQAAVNMSLGIIPCIANITAQGTCSVLDVQRIVNASLGGACVTGP